MYVSQVPATLIYSVIKTLYLSLLSLIVISFCSWIKCYYLAKIFEQGFYIVLFGSITSKRYWKYHRMFILLFIFICFNVIINLLPSIFTRFMPFESKIITIQEDVYFDVNYYYYIPSYVTIPTNGSMDNYCKEMRMCDINGIYYDNIPKVSPTLKVESITFDFENCVFNTRFGNYSFDNLCVYINGMHNSNFTYNGLTREDIRYYFDQYVNGTTNYYISNNTYDITIFMLNLLTWDIDRESEINYSSFHSQTDFQYSTILSMLYGREFLTTYSSFQRSYIMNSDKNYRLILVIKAILINYPNGPKDFFFNMDNNLFNNTRIIYDYISGLNKTLGFTVYKTDNEYIAIDIVQYNSNEYFGCISKVRLLFSFYMIYDNNFDNLEDSFIRPKVITDFNFSLVESNYYAYYSILLEDVVNNFNDAPSNDMFMYALMYNNVDQNRMYGIQAYRNVVADIPVIFFIINLLIVFILFILYLISRYYNKFYFITLLETIGISNLPKINENENEMLLNEE